MVPNPRLLNTIWPRHPSTSGTKKPPTILFPRGMVMFHMTRHSGGRMEFILSKSLWRFSWYSLCHLGLYLGDKTRDKLVRALKKVQCCLNVHTQKLHNARKCVFSGWSCHNTIILLKIAIQSSIGIPKGLALSPPPQNACSRFGYILHKNLSLIVTPLHNTTNWI